MSWEKHLFLWRVKNGCTERKKKKKESEITDARGTEELQTFLIANYFVQKRTLIVSKQEQAQKVKEMSY